MKRVLLIHGAFIPHYRVPIYGRLSEYLRKHGFELVVTSDRIQKDNPNPVRFDYVEMPLSARSIGRVLVRKHIDAVIMFVDMRHRYLFPTYAIAKGLLRKKMIWWGQGRDLAAPNAHLKNLAYATEHALCDSIILYAERLKNYVSPRFHHKLFFANNTLCLDYPGLPPERKTEVLKRHGIQTRKNIICVGRMQRRKRIEYLAEVHASMGRSDIGLILAGPDTDGVLDDIKGPGVYKVGPIYGDRKFDLLSASDVYCLPGAVGLSIVDAFHCGLPLVTEEGSESAELMYLKNGENGFAVRRDNREEMKNRLLTLLDDEQVRGRFSAAAKREIAVNGHIDKLCAGFRDALLFAMRNANGRRAEPGNSPSRASGCGTASA